MVKKIYLFPVLLIIVFALPVYGSANNGKVGINLGELRNWSPLWIFVDQMKQSRVWDATDTGWVNLFSGVAVPKRSSDGYPTHSPFTSGTTNYYPHTSMMTDLENLYPAGAYTLIFKGTGTVFLSGDAPNVTCSVPDTPYTVLIETPTSTGVYLTLLASDINNPVYDIRFIMPGYAATYQGEPFYPDFINNLRDFSVVRFMVTTFTHWTDIVSWNDKAGPDFYTQGSIANAGLAYEYIPIICNQAQADPWINIPYKADDNYVQQVATILFQNLDNQRKVYLEYGNENWSYEYNVYNYTRTQGLNQGLDYPYSGNPDGATATDLAGWRYSVKRALQVFKIFENVFGGDERLIKVLASQPEWKVIMEVMLEASTDTVRINPDNITIDGIATSPYYALTLADDVGNAGNAATVTTQELIDSSLAYLRNQIPGWVRQMKELSDRYNLPLYAYEGGMHLKTLIYNNDPAYVNKILAVSRDSQIEGIYKELFSTWYLSGGQMFCYHDLCSRYDKYNSFGLLEYMGQDPVSSPKYRAVTYVLNSTATAPSNFTGTAVSTTAINWSWNASQNAKYYYIYSATSTGINDFLVKLSSDNLSWLQQNLTPDTTYQFRAGMYNIFGDTSPLSGISLAVTDHIIDGTPPAKITGLEAYQHSSSNTIKVYWITPGDDGSSGALTSGSGYKIQYSTSDPVSVNWSTSSAQISISTSGTAPGLRVFTTVNLPLNKTYYLKLWAKDEEDNWSIASDTAAVFCSPFSLEMVDDGTYRGDQVDMALDSSGAPHIAYGNQTNFPFYKTLYAKGPGPGWFLNTAYDDYAGTDNSITVDPSGIVYLAFGCYLERNARLSKWNGQSWTSEVFDQGDMGGTGFRAVSMALDGGGHPHISYHESDPDDLKYAWHNGVAWSTATLETVNDIGEDTSLALDAAGNPHIAYYDATAYDLKYTFRTGSNWTVRTVDSTGQTGQYPALALDGNGAPHISYYDLTQGSLKYAKWNGASWDIEIVHDLPSGNLGQHTSIALDGAGYPHISYYQNVTQDLYYAYYNGAGWVLFTVDSEINKNPSGGDGIESSIAINSSGAVVIAYHSEKDFDVKYAKWAGAGFASPMGGNPRSRIQMPDNFRAAGVYFSSITWRWTDSSSNEVGFRLYGAAASTGPFTLIAGTDTIIANSNFFDETGLSTGTYYFRYLAAVNAGGIVTSSGALAQTLSGAGPDIPSGPVIAGESEAISSTAIKWVWTDNSDNETGFRVKNSTNGIVSDLSVNTTYWIEGQASPSLQVNTSYYRYVEAYNTAGSSASSAVIIYTFSNPPASPEIADVFYSSITLTWSDNGNPYYTDYRVELWQGSGSTETTVTPALIKTLTGLTESATCFIRLCSINEDGIPSQYTAVLSTVTKRIVILPEAPAPQYNYTVTVLVDASGISPTISPPTGEMMVTVPAGCFDSPINLTVRASTSAFPAPEETKNPLMQATTVAVEILTDAPVNIKKEIEIILIYRDQDVSGMDENKLIIARYNSSGGNWLPLLSYPYPEQNKVRAYTDHLSLFRIMHLGSPVSGGKGVVFPNPFYPYKGHKNITFYGFSPEQKLNIYTLTPELVRELQLNTAGMTTWDGKNSEGKPVSSGVYIYRTLNPSGKSESGKLVILK